MNKNDAKDIYNLMLKVLKDKLEDPECKDSTLKIALDFVKTFGLEDEVIQQPKIKKILEELPFK
jgi:hypothetical protein